jgi:hypothetical protein
LSNTGTTGNGGRRHKYTPIPNLRSGAVLAVFPQEDETPQPATPSEQADIKAAIAASEVDPQPTGDIPTLPHTFI